MPRRPGDAGAKIPTREEARRREPLLRAARRGEQQAHDALWRTYRVLLRDPETGALLTQLDPRR